MKYFSMKECTYSEVAEKNNLANIPDAICTTHIIESVDTLLDPLQDAWKQFCKEHNYTISEIRIISGYRSQTINQIKYGTTESAHCLGYAFDITPQNGHIEEFKYFCRDFLLQYKKFDQLISVKEYGKGIPLWMHVAYKGPNEQQRCQCFSMVNGKYRKMT